jgi:hypothetical protein
MQKKPLMFYPTQINVQADGENAGTHSIVFAVTVTDSVKQVYFFDPNGYYTDIKHNVLFRISNKIYPNTTLWIKEVEKLLKLDVQYLTVSGPQFFDVSPEEGSGFIDKGGYCMFYNLLFIHFFTKNPNDLSYFFRESNSLKTNTKLIQFYGKVFTLDMREYSFKAIQNLITNCHDRLVKDPTHKHYSKCTLKCSKCKKCQPAKEQKSTPIKKKSTVTLKSKKYKPVLQQIQGVPKKKHRESNWCEKLFGYSKEKVNKCKQQSTMSFSTTDGSRKHKSKRRKSVKKSRRRKSKRRKSVRKSRRRKSVRKSRRRKSVRKSRRRKSVRKSRRRKSKRRKSVRKSCRRKLLH